MTFTIAPDQTFGKTLNVFNQDEGGDYGTVYLVLKNADTSPHPTDRSSADARVHARAFARKASNVDAGADSNSSASLDASVFGLSRH